MSDIGFHRFLMLLKCAQIHNARGDRAAEQRAVEVAKQVAERYGIPFAEPVVSSRPNQHQEANDA